MSHIKRHVIPGGWGISRKAKVYTVAPTPGPHKKSECIPLLIIVRDLLSYAHTGSEAKKIINRGIISVDGVVRKEYNYPAGFMDTISIGGTSEHFRLVLADNGLKLEKIDEASAGRKPCIIKSRHTTKGGIECITLHDGRVMQLGKGKSDYRPGDTVIVEFGRHEAKAKGKTPSRTCKIAGHFRVEKGAGVMIINGKNRGVRGKVKDVRDRKFMTEKSIVIVESEGREIETIKAYVMATGHEKEGRK